MEGSGGRRIGVAVDFSSCSKKALSWAVDNVARDGDHLILITIRPEGHYEEGEMQLWETTGSPSYDLNYALEFMYKTGKKSYLRSFLNIRSEFSEAAVMKKYGVKPDSETLDIVNTAAKQKPITVLMKIYWGDAREKICEAVDHIPLSSLVIGNRGLGGLKRVIMGSVSNYVVNNASCPVTVVKSDPHHTS